MAIGIWNNGERMVPPVRHHGRTEAPRGQCAKAVTLVMADFGRRWQATISGHRGA
jgi:hypothetical protein